MIEELRERGSFAVDTETTSLQPTQAELVGVSLSAADMRAFYVPFNQELLAALAPLLCDPQLERIGQNTKYDWLVFANAGLELPPPDFDTMIASYCVAGTSRRHGLDELALTYFDLTKIPTTDLIGTGKNQISMADVPVGRVGEYAAEDADVTFRLAEVLDKELDDTQTRELFEGLEMPLVPVLVALEERGIQVDVGVLSEIGRDMEHEIEE